FEVGQRYGNKRDRREHLQGGNDLASAVAEHFAYVRLTEQLIEFERSGYGLSLNLQFRQPRSKAVKVLGKTVEVTLAEQREPGAQVQALQGDHHAPIEGEFFEHAGAPGSRNLRKIR